MSSAWAGHHGVASADGHNPLGSLSRATVWYAGGQTPGSFCAHDHSVEAMGRRRTAITRFGPGLTLHEPLGMPCSGCGRAIVFGQRGYLLKDRARRDEVWHRSCFHDAAGLSDVFDWIGQRPDVVPEPDHAP